MDLLLISNSTMAGEAYLGWPKEAIKDFLEGKAKKVLFIPYAGVNLAEGGLNNSWDAYEKKVAEVYNGLGFELYSIHKEDDPVKAVKEAEAVAVGGGNTFHLVYEMHKNGIMKPLREKALNGMPYMGWSAGSNVACPKLKTTNDMPITEPESFDCLNLIPFQINPHYLDAHPDGHGGETREQRINEFIEVNQDIYVLGLREACYLKVEENRLKLFGQHSARVFKYGMEAKEFRPSENIDFLLR